VVRFRGAVFMYHRGVDLIARLWSGEPDAISNAKFYRWSPQAVIRVF